MTDTVVRLRRGSKHFEVVVDQDLALAIRRGQSEDVGSALLDKGIFHNVKDGSRSSTKDLEEAFGTTDVDKVALSIIKKGELEVSQEHRDKQQELKEKQIVEWYIKNSVDAKSGRPFTSEIIRSSIEQAGVKIDNKPVEQQISRITQDLSKVIPIKIETKKLKITIPAIYTGKVYGIVNEYKEKEEWLGNGDLTVTINIPIGLQLEFYDKLNSITHGAAISEEIKDKE